MSAPAFSKVLTTSLCPLAAARISGVACRYKINHCVLKAMDITYAHILSSFTYFN